MALRDRRFFEVKFGCRPPRCASVSLWLKLGEKRRGRRAKKKKNRFLRALCASARVQAFQVLVAVCPSVQSFAENSAFSAKFVLLRFLCVLLFGRAKAVGAVIKQLTFAAFRGGPGGPWLGRGAFWSWQAPASPPCSPKAEGAVLLIALHFQAQRSRRHEARPQMNTDGHRQEKLFDLC